MTDDKDKTHYRKAFKSPYLSSADITAPTLLVIKEVKLEPDKSKRTKDLFNTAYFVADEIRTGEKLKPMILNVQNSKIICHMVGSAFINDWINVPITVYVDHNVRFGRDVVEGLRISPEKPVTEKPVLQRDSNQWISAVDAYKRDGNLDKVIARVTVTKEDREQIIKEAGIAG